MLKRISHIGVVVEDLEEALALWRDVFGLKQFAEMDIDVEGIRSVFLSVSGEPGEMTVELMQPKDKTDMNNAVARRLAKSGEGFYHLAVVVDDVADAADKLEQSGLQILGRAAIEQGGAGRWLVHPKGANGVMIEGLEEWQAASPSIGSRG
jgi:methylmalonyl-CoA epimerase